MTQAKSREGDGFFNTTTLYLPIVRDSLPPHISLLNEWQSLSREHSFVRYNHEHHGCKGNVFRLRIEDRTGTSFVKDTVYEEQGKDDAA